MEEGFFLEGTGQVSFFSISVNFSVLTKSLRSGEKKGFLALYIYIYYIDGSACDVVKKDIWQYKDIILQSAPLSSCFLQYFNHHVTLTFRIQLSPTKPNPIKM